MLPSPAVIAHRDAQRLALVFEEIAGDGAPLAGGWMACDVEGSWASYAAGIGVDGPPTDEQLDELVAFYRVRGREPRIQVTPYEHAALHQGLAKRGFVVEELVTLLAHPLTDLQPVDAPAGLTFRKVDPDDDDDLDAWLRVQLQGFYDDEEAPPGIVDITRRVGAHPRSDAWLLEMDGELVGSGGLERYEGSSVLIAGAVRPGWRGRGVQSAFIRFRLHEATAAGDDYALVGSLVNGGTERNALRAGFLPQYTLVDLRQPVANGPEDEATSALLPG